MAFQQHTALHAPVAVLGRDRHGERGVIQWVAVRTHAVQRLARRLDHLLCTWVGGDMHGIRGLAQQAAAAVAGKQRSAAAAGGGWNVARSRQHTCMRHILELAWSAWAPPSSSRARLGAILLGMWSPGSQATCRVVGVSIVAVQVGYNCDAAEGRSLKLCMAS